MHVLGHREHVSSRRIQRSWRAFASQGGTTAQLARAFMESGPSLTAPLRGAAASESHGDAMEAEGAQDDSTPSGLIMVGGIGGSSSGGGVAHRGFEDFAERLQAPATLQATQVRGARRPSMAMPWPAGAASTLMGVASLRACHLRVCT